jgi:hypothetical protein
VTGQARRRFGWVVLALAFVAALLAALGLVALIVR